MEKRIFQYRSGYWESIASGVKEAVQRGDQVLSSRTVMYAIAQKTKYGKIIKPMRKNVLYGLK